MFDWLRNRAKSAEIRQQERITAYVDGQLTPAERTAFEAQMRDDAALRAEVESLRLLKTGLQSLPRVSAPRNFVLNPADFAKPAPAYDVMAYPVLRVATAMAGLMFMLLLVFASLSSGRSGPAAEEAAFAPAAESVMVEEVADAEMAETVADSSIDMDAAAMDAAAMDAAEAEVLLEEEAMEEEAMEIAPAEIAREAEVVAEDALEAADDAMMADEASSEVADDAMMADEAAAEPMPDGELDSSDEMMMNGAEDGSADAADSVAAASSSAPQPTMTPAGTALPQAASSEAATSDNEAGADSDMAASSAEMPTAESRAASDASAESAANTIVPTAPPLATIALPTPTTESFKTEIAEPTLVVELDSAETIAENTTVETELAVEPSVPADVATNPNAQPPFATLLWGLGVLFVLLLLATFLIRRRLNDI